MQVIGSPLNTTTGTAHASAHAELIAKLRERITATARGGSEKSRQRHLDRGKLFTIDASGSSGPST